MEHKIVAAFTFILALCLTIIVVVGTYRLCVDLLTQ
jgi:hypothetical protein